MLHPVALRALALLAAAASAHGQYRWTPIDTAGAPGARFGHAMTMVHPSQDIVLFGGTDGVNVLGDTWTWGHHTIFASSPIVWTQRTGPGPAARHGHTLERLDLSGGALLFGGRGTGGELLGDTWRFDGAWTELAPSVAPSPRVGHAVANDEMAIGTLYLFGGRTASGLDDGLWRLQSGDWTRLVTATTPPAREEHTLAFDFSAGRVLPMGGRDDRGLLNDTWPYDGQDWRPANTVPAVRLAGHTMDMTWGGRQRHLVVGGLEGAPSVELFERTDAGQLFPHSAIGAPVPRTGHAAGGCGLLVRPFARRTARLVPQGFGASAEFTIEIPFVLALRGTTLAAQVLILEPTAGTFSQGLRMHIEE